MLPFFASLDGHFEGTKDVLFCIHHHSSHTASAAAFCHVEILEVQSSEAEDKIMLRMLRMPNSK